LLWDQLLPSLVSKRIHGRVWFRTSQGNALKSFDFFWAALDVKLTKSGNIFLWLLAVIGASTASQPKCIAHMSSSKQEAPKSTSVSTPTLITTLWGQRLPKERGMAWLFCWL